MRDLKTLCEQKRVSGALLTVKDFSETIDHFEFSGIATTPKKDRVGDIVEPMGAEFALPVTLLSKHQGEKPIGKVVFAKATKTGIPYKARIPYVKEAGIVRERVLEAIHEVKYGLISNVSIGFKALRDGIELMDDGLRFLKWEWLELSLTGIPANDEATITAFKSLDVELRAALGAQKRGDEGGEANPRTGAPGTQSKGKIMRTMKQMTERRGEVAARITELHEGCGGDFSTLGDGERDEFDALETEQQGLDADIRRQKAVEAAARGAQPIESDPDKATGRRGTVAPKPQPFEKGVAFSQYCKYLGRAKGNPMQALAMAQREIKLLDPRVPIMLKAAVEGGTTTGTPTAGNWGMELVGTETGAVADFLDFLRPTLILGKFGQGGIPALHRVPFRVPLVGLVGGGQGYWVGEGKGKPVTKFAMTRTHLDPLKVAAITVASMELLRDSSPAADTMLRDQLAKALRQTSDLSFIDPANGGSAGVEPASITNGITPIPSAGNTAADVRTDIAAVFGAFIAANNPPSSGVWIMQQSTAMKLGLMRNALGQREFPEVGINGGTLEGIPVITSQNVPSDSSGAFVMLVNADEIYYGDDGDVKVDASEHASIEMSDAPTNEIITPTANAYSVSMFQTNSTAFRAERTLDWMRARESAVAVLSGVNWS